MLGELISGGLSLIGGLFGKKKEKPQKTEMSVDYVKMAKEAQRAGFNPLTALRNGGSAGFTSSTTSHPGLSSNWDAVGQIGGALGSALEKRFDPIEQKRTAVESALLDYQLAAIQSGPKTPMMFGDVPTKAAAAVARQLTPPMGAKRKAAPTSSKIVPGDNPTASSIGLEDRFGWYHDTEFPDGQVLGNVYGEPGEWLGGAVKFGMDAWHTAKTHFNRLADEGRKKGPDGLTIAERQYKDAEWFREALREQGWTGVLGSAFFGHDAWNGKNAPKTSW